MSKTTDQQYITFIEELLSLLEDVHVYVDEIEFSDEEKEIVKQTKFTYIFNEEE